MSSNLKSGFEPTVISSFRDEYFFLSNYDVNPFVWRGITFSSGEQAFAYAKTYFAIQDLRPGSKGVTEAQYFQEYILAAKTPGDAKKCGRQVKIDVVSWDQRKVHYMREIVHAKFRGVKDYAGKLINTGASPLVEGNTWGDTFWGKCRVDGKIVGLNMLGTILMEERGYWLYGALDLQAMGMLESTDIDKLQRLAADNGQFS